jgi:Ca2+:H+ antiporter
MSVTEETSISEPASERKKRKNKIPIAVWFLALTPVVIVYNMINPTAHTVLFALSVAAIVPLAMVLSQSTESVAAKTGDMVGGLLNATLGNLTELIIALTALKAGEFVLVKASMAGALITNTLFMLGASFLFGGLKHHMQDFNKAGARLQSGMMFLASVALLVPSLIAVAGTSGKPEFVQDLSMAIAIILLVTYALGLVFSLKTHKSFFAAAGGGNEGHEEALWPLAVALPVLAIVTVGIALVSEIFVESVQIASEDLGLSPAFVGFIVVALVGAAAEMATAFSAARKDRLDLSVSIGMGSASQIALFVAPVLVLLSYVIAPTPMDMVFWPGAVLMVMIATLTSTLVTSSGRSAWFVGVLMLAVYLVFASTLFLIPPKVG